MKYAKGIMWLDDCRIPFVDEADIQSAIQYGNTDGVKIYGRNSYNKSITTFEEKPKPSPKGRFTPNLLVCDDLLNDGSVGGGGKMKKSGFRIGGKSDISVGLNGKKEAPDNYGDKGTNSRYYDLDTWFDKIIDEIR